MLRLLTGDWVAQKSLWTAVQLEGGSILGADVSPTLFSLALSSFSARR